MREFKFGRRLVPDIPFETLPQELSRVVKGKPLVTFHFDRGKPTGFEIEERLGHSHPRRLTGGI